MNLYRDKIFYNKTVSSYPIDVGVLKIWRGRDGDENLHQLALGATVKNILGSRAELLNGPEALPTVLTAGTAYRLLLRKQDFLQNLYTLALTLEAEYQDILNYDYRQGAKFGAEVSLFQILNVRMGYYSIKLDPSPTNGKKRLSDFTYGFGVDLPFDAFLGRHFPLTITLDVTSLKQPSYVADFDDWENFTAYSINLNWGK